MFCLCASFFLVKAQSETMFKTGKIPPSKVSVLQLFLAGSFNGWNPADTAWEMHRSPDGTYHLEARLPPGNYQFKVTRGSWQQAECSADGKPADNRSLILKGDTTVVLDISGWQDSFPPLQKKHTASANVHILSDDFDMPQLGRKRRIWIYLPADYRSSGRRYPVIYMQDGQNLFDGYTSGFGEWGVDEIMDRLPDSQASIIVGIDHGGDYRITEYDPYNSKFGKGRGDAYAAFVAETLKPYIDGHFHTVPDASHTTIAGSSMGGLISMYIALKYPEQFGNAGIFSPSFWIAPDIYRFAQQQKLSGYSRFYFACGDAESSSMVNDMQKMAAVIRGKGRADSEAPITIAPGAAHNEKQWHADFVAFYNWLRRIK